jgi:hypothetical protein
MEAKKNKPKSNRVNLQITREYKKILDKHIIELSSRVEERVPMTKLLYKLIDNYAEKAVRDLEKEY